MTLEAHADHSVPLYESIFEIVDADCYQLGSIIGQLAGSTLVDIGANIGITSLCLSQIPGASVHAFEPSPGTRRYLEDNLRRNSCTNVTVRRHAVAARTGTMNFWVPEHETVGATEWKPWMTGSGQKLEVDCISVSEMLASVPGPIGLMKVDCEGGEYEIVESLTPELVKRIERMTFEVHDRGPDRDLAALMGALERRGYGLMPKPDPFGRAGGHHLLALRR